MLEGFVPISLPFFFSPIHWSIKPCLWCTILHALNIRSKSYNYLYGCDYLSMSKFWGCAVGLTNFLKRCPSNHLSNISEFLQWFQHIEAWTEPNGRNFADDIRSNFIDNIFSFVKTSLMLVPGDQVYSLSALVQVTILCQTGCKSWTTDDPVYRRIYVSPCRLKWVKGYWSPEQKRPTFFRQYFQMWSRKRI